LELTIMLMLNLSMLLIGSALGLRFRVLILLPAIGLVWMAYLAVGVVLGDALSAILVGGTLAAMCLQIGYLVGASVAHGPLTSRAPKISRHGFSAEKLR
jgi:hypothetical protein